MVSGRRPDAGSQLQGGGSTRRSSIANGPPTEPASGLRPTTARETRRPDPQLVCRWPRSTYAEYKNDVLNGAWTEWHKLEPHKLSAQLSLVDGNRTAGRSTGTPMAQTPGSDLQERVARRALVRMVRKRQAAQGTYVNDKPEGKVSFWYEDGQPWAVSISPRYRRAETLGMGHRGQVLSAGIEPRAVDRGVHRGVNRPLADASCSALWAAWAPQCRGARRLAPVSFSGS